MDQEYGKLIVKFYDKQKQKFVIPIGKEILIFNNDIVNLAHFRNRIHTAIDTTYVCFGGNKKSPRVNRSSNVIMKAAPILGKKYLEYCAGIALEYIATKGIYDLMEEDFLNSEGGSNAFRDYRNEFIKAHKSPMMILNESILEAKEWLKSMTGTQIAHKISNGIMDAALMIEEDAYAISGNIQYFDNNKKCTAILNNLKNGRIPDEQKERAICQIIQMNPFNEVVYKTYKDYLSDRSDFIQIMNLLMLEERILPPPKMRDESETFSSIDEKFSKEILDDLIIDESILEKIESNKILDQVEMELETESKENGKINQEVDIATPREDSHSKSIQMNVEEIIRSLCSKYDIGGLYFIGTSAKGNEKITKALKAYGNSVLKDDSIIACYDGTLFGGAGEGFILTNKGICIKEWLQDVKYLNYSAICKISLSEQNVFLNDMRLSTAMMGDSGRIEFCKLARELINIICGIDPILELEQKEKELIALEMEGKATLNKNENDALIQTYKDVFSDNNRFILYGYSPNKILMLIDKQRIWKDNENPYCANIVICSFEYSGSDMVLYETLDRLTWDNDWNCITMEVGRVELHNPKNRNNDNFITILTPKANRPYELFEKITPVKDWHYSILKSLLNSAVGIICKKCGKELPPDSRFCTACGSPV